MASQSGHNSTTKMRECCLGTAVGLVKTAGELVAVTAPLPKTGYKNDNAYGAKPVFDGETTNKHFQRKTRRAAESTCLHKKLMPYHPNAPRNRPKETMQNIIGKRYGVHPSIAYETYKGQSHITFVDADPESRKPWKTTNQVFSAGTQVQDMVGLANAGISSDIAKRLHSTQGIYH